LKKLTAILAGVVCLGGAIVAAQQTTPKKATSSKTATSRKGKRPTVSSRTSSKKGQTWRTRQAQPSPERYKEIQGALAQKGYFKSEPTGVWNQDSSDALRHFQEDQKLEASGKIDSLSLIALGLGPKHEPAPATAPRSGP
jgi:putative peptidoglycan binding protein